MSIDKSPAAEVFQAIEHAVPASVAAIALL